MSLKKILSVFLFGLICLSGAYAQGIPGYNVSNYAGISGIFLNPASIADSRYKFDMTLVGGGATLGNDFISVTRKWYKHDGENVDWKQAGYIRANEGERANLNVGAYAVLPSFMVTLNKNIALGFTFRARSYVNADHINQELARFFYNGFDVPSLYNIKLQNDQFNINAMAWGEYGLAYAQVIKGGGPHFLKVGGQVKFISGITAAYFYARDLSYSWDTKDTLNLYSSGFGYGTSDNLQGELGSIRFKYVTNPALGLDIGAVYEFRPNYDSYLYEMDGVQGLERKDKNKYKARLGVSLVDLGRIKFKRSPYSGDFNADIRKWPVKNVTFSGSKTPIKDISDTLNRRFNFRNDEAYFTMALPTAFSVQLDYNIYKNFYANFTSYISPRFIKTESKVHALNYYTIGPRWDSKWFGVFVPVAINAYGQTSVGTTLRLGPLVVGTTNIGALLFQKYVYGYDVHFALKIPIMYGKPKDRDNDHVSNKMDKCPDQPGTWVMHGCPDKDGDGITDKEDNCPTVYGSPKAHGCPDIDGDGIPDKDDKCPSEPGSIAAKGCPDMDNDSVPDKIDLCPETPGLVKLDGCPDMDGDGIADADDKCPDVAGPKDNNGCPYGDRDKDSVADKDDKCPDLAGDVAHSGCPDSDGDGVYDNDDQCPSQPGTIENHGCPEKKAEPTPEPVKPLDTDNDGVPDNADRCPNVAGSSAHSGCPDTDGDGVFDDQDKCPKTSGSIANNGCPDVDKADKDVAKKAFNNLEFEAHSAIISPSSYPTLEELAKLMKDHPKYKLRVAGYTDSTGSEEANISLSRHRAIAVQVFLYERGVDPGRVDIEAHGEADPIDTNATEEGRRHNRRVEIDIKFE